MFREKLNKFLLRLDNWAPATHHDKNVQGSVNALSGGKAWSLIAWWTTLVWGDKAGINIHQAINCGVLLTHFVTFMCKLWGRVVGEIRSICCCFSVVIALETLKMLTYVHLPNYRISILTTKKRNFFFIHTKAAVFGNSGHTDLTVQRSKVRI